MLHLRGLFIIIALTLVYCCTACSEKNEINVAQESYVKWYEKENELEVYVVVSNSTKHDVSFQASLIFLDEKLKEAVGLETEQLKTDDRNNTSPFHLISFNETVFQRKYKTHSKLTREMLSEGIGIKITDQQKTYTMAIKYGEIQR
ncbi:hypothetical protein [Cohnella sp. GCM10027633]|uniref:hypothetical protein n=1 Tax=unclassified Cohnella TaxID=2636738 RepID=UPI003624DBBD